MLRRQPAPRGLVVVTGGMVYCPLPSWHLTAHEASIIESECEERLNVFRRTIASIS